MSSRGETRTKIRELERLSPRSAPEEWYIIWSD